MLCQVSSGTGYPEYGHLRLTHVRMSHYLIEKLDTADDKFILTFTKLLNLK
jgi:hypothetical protein